MSTELVTTKETSMTALVPRSIAEAITLAEMMASASLVPAHLQGKPGDCLLIVMQAQKWGMDAFSVAQCTSVVRGKLCYEGKLVAAVLYSMGAIDGRFSYTFDGEGAGRSVVVTAKHRGADQKESIDGSVAAWQTDNAHWKKSPDDMLVYRGTRQWARRHAPEAMLGVNTPDEIADEVIAGEFTPSAPATIQQPTSKSGKAKAAAKPKASPDPAQEAADASDEAIGGEAAEDGAETGEFLSKESMRKTLNVCLKRAGLELRHLQTEFPRIDDTNINAVLSYLSKLSANAD